jgi:transcriptional regulator with XRE-family HTH domain
MPKIEMSAELGIKIKELRLNHQVKAKDLAVHMEKSPAYISKLENGEIKQIEYSLFVDMINFITGNENGYENFMTKFSEDIAIDEFDKSTLLQNFDTIDRQIPVSEELVQFIKNKMSQLHIDALSLIEYINKNEDLDENFFAKNSIIKADCKENIWIYYKTVIDGESHQGFFILLNYSVEQLLRLLSGEIESTNHTFIYAIVYHLLKYENNNIDNKESNDVIQKRTSEILRSYKFYTISDRRDFAEKSNSKQEYDKLLSDFDKKNMHLINQLLSSISFISDYDVKYANEKLSLIVNNLEIDSSFALSFMALPLKELADVNVRIKKEFLQEVKMLIETYEDKAKSEVIVEKY